MFVELTKEAWEKLKVKLDKLGYSYDVKDCTLPGDSIKHVHIDFGELEKVKASEIANEIDNTYAEIAEQSMAEAKMMEEQMMKNLQSQEDERNKEDARKHEKERPSDRRYHTLGEEFMAAAMGINLDEQAR